MQPVLLPWSPGTWVVALADAQGRCAGQVYAGPDLDVAHEALRLAAAGHHTHVECQWAEIACDCGFLEGAQPAQDPAAHHPGA